MLNEIKSCRLQIRCTSEETVSFNAELNGDSCTAEGISVCLTEQHYGNVRAAGIMLDMRKEAEEWSVKTLARERAVRVMFPIDSPEAMTALYLFGPWWTRPAFINDFRDIPDMTQVLFLKYADHCECLVPMVGQKWKSVVNGGSEDCICLDMISNVCGITYIDEPLFVLASGKTARKAAHAAFEYIAGYKGIKTREARRIPEQFDYLGWCSWDAFYIDVSEKGIRDKAKELSEKDVPVRWMIIDDGWMSVNGRLLTDLRPDPVKFPGGMKKMTAELRRDHGIKWFGVWHALGGYWDGVEPGSEAASKEAAFLSETVNGALVPDCFNGAGFYRDWYRQLADDGIDFVKVDGQGAASIYYRDTVPVSEAARGMMQSLESGAFIMDETVINCMGMPMENILGRTVSAVSRNSDDFFPQRKESFKEHLLQNAYNSLYHDEINCCDWDMFWTGHPDGKKHSLLRAISGGPVYFSDRVGETAVDVIRPLCCLDGKLLKTDRSARPTESCIFKDPFNDCVLVLHTCTGIAAFNLTEEEREYSFAPCDIPEYTDEGEYWVYDFFGKQAFSLGYDEEYTARLGKDGYAWYVIIPENGHAACLGLSDKYVGTASIEASISSDEYSVYTLSETGNVSWLSENECSEVTVNGADMTDSVVRNGDLYTLAIDERPEKMILSIR